MNRKMLEKNKIYTYGLAVISLLGTLLSFAAPSHALERVSEHKDWAVFTHSNNSDKMCFAVSKPKDMEPKNVRRGEVLFYMTRWKGVSTSHEISIKIGYPFSSNSKPTVAIGGQKFRLFVEGDKAWVADTKSEKRLVRAMQKGSSMLISGVSRRGTVTKDRYSLSGVTAASNRVAQECK